MKIEEILIIDEKEFKNTNIILQRTHKKKIVIQICKLDRDTIFLFSTHNFNFTIITIIDITLEINFYMEFFKYCQ